MSEMRLNSSLVLGVTGARAAADGADYRPDSQTAQSSGEQAEDAPRQRRGQGARKGLARQFFRHIREPVRALSALLKSGRAPAELMVIYAARDARRGRNDPCTCGSGRKWKHCHNAGPAR